MDISIIIPNYNGEKLLKKNLPSVFAAVSFYEEKTKHTAEIIVVDDASTDASTTVISSIRQAQDKNFKFIQNERNLGFSSTVNKGVEQAKGDIVILLNSDVSPTRDFLMPLMPHFEDKKVFAVGSMDKSIEAGKEVLRGRGIGKWERGFLVHAAGILERKNSLWASGGSSAFKKDIWEVLGGLDELFNPFYWEDIDLSYRALKSGYSVLFEKKSIVVHEHEEGAIKTKFTKRQVQEIAYRNQFLFVWKNADRKHIYAHIIWLPYHFGKALLRADGTFFIAFFHAFSMLSEVLKKRKTVLEKFVFSDDAILSEYKE